mgnify:CR=1 FL=1
MNTSSLIAANAARWAKARVTRTGCDSVAKRLVGAKARYKEIEKATGVPWFIIAVIHERESGQDFTKQLAQGDPLNKVSTHVPKGRGPFLNHRDDLPNRDAFYRGALDALIDCAPYAAKWKDWSPGGAMTLLEQYNGLGYANKGRPSPYVWSGTDQYVSGKYVADGVYSATAVDQQLGCAGLVLAMQKLDPSIKFGAPTAAVPTIPAPKPTPAPVPAPVKPSLANTINIIINAILGLFKR